MNYIKSPLNYVGGKFKLLPQILPLFPDNVNVFIDLFSGGSNVAVNVKANKYLINDTETEVIRLIDYIFKTDLTEMLNIIQSYINYYHLDRVNKDGYLKLRSDYNANKLNRHPLHFYTLVCHAFSNQIRFNSNNEFNMPFGKRTFNDKLKIRFIEFVEKLKTLDIHTSNLDFRDIESSISEDDFVYCDPPYLIATAAYNEQNGWTEKDEIDLLSLLDRLNVKNIKFALSNVLVHKGKTNQLLTDWAMKYNIHYLNNSYANCNYQTRDKSKDSTMEVLITNY